MKRRVVDQELPRMERNRTVWTATTGIVVLLASLLGGIVAYVGPRTYESRCVVELLPASAEVAKLNDGETLAEQVRTAAEVMVLQVVCNRVSDALDLGLRWGLDRESTVLVLKGAVAAEVIPGTTLIEIRTRMHDAEDARDVAMEVPEAFRDRLAEIEDRQLESQLACLDRFEQDLDFEKDQLVKRFDVDAADGKIQSEIAGIEAKRTVVAGERGRLELRRRVPVERLVVHEQPTLARSPVAPDVPLIFVGWVLGGLVVGLILGWWLSGVVGQVRRVRELEPGLATADAW